MKTSRRLERSRRDSTASFSVNARNGYLGVSLRGNEWWGLDVAEPSSYTKIVPAAFLDAMRYPFQNPQKGGLNFSGEGGAATS